VASRAARQFFIEAPDIAVALQFEDDIIGHSVALLLGKPLAPTCAPA
jgi:hypothetical protein